MSWVPGMSPENLMACCGGQGNIPVRFPSRASVSTEISRIAHVLDPGASVDVTVESDNGFSGVADFPQGYAGFGALPARHLVKVDVRWDCNSGRTRREQSLKHILEHYWRPLSIDRVLLCQKRGNCAEPAAPLAPAVWRPLSAASSTWSLKPACTIVSISGPPSIGQVLVLGDPGLTCRLENTEPYQCEFERVSSALRPGGFELRLRPLVRTNLLRLVLQCPENAGGCIEVEVEGQSAPAHTCMGWPCLLHAHLQSELTPGKVITVRLKSKFKLLGAFPNPVIMRVMECSQKAGMDFPNVLSSDVAGIHVLEQPLPLLSPPKIFRDHYRRMAFLNTALPVQCRSVGFERRHVCRMEDGQYKIIEQGVIGVKGLPPWMKGMAGFFLSSWIERHPFPYECAVVTGD